MPASHGNVSLTSRAKHCTGNCYRCSFQLLLWRSWWPHSFLAYQLGS